MRSFAIFSSIFFLFLFIQKGNAQAPTFSGFARNYTGVYLEEPNDLAILQNTLELKMEKRSGDVELVADPMIYHYPGEDLDFRMRELYIDLYTDHFDFRVGKQQIVWGRADGIFITDVVTPKDYSEFLLRPLDEIRRGITSVKTTGYWKDHSLELVWIPAFEPNLFGSPGSDWHTEPDIPPNARIDKSQKEVPLELENGEYFAKYSLKKASFDLDLMGGHTWMDDPVLHRKKSMDPSTGRLVITVSPQHHRTSFTGMGFSTEVLGIVVRGEGAWYYDRSFMTLDPKAEEGVVEKDFLHYMGGLEKFVGEWKFSGQFIHEYLPEHEQDMVRAESKELATLMISRTLFREKLRVEWFNYVGITDEDALSRLRVFYDLKGGSTLEVGANTFFGDEGRFGRFDENDMVYTRFRYDF